MDYSQGVGNHAVVETGPRWKSPSVSLADVLINPRVFVYEVGKHLEGIEGRRCYKLLRPLSLSNRCFVIDCFDATKEDIEATYNKGGVKVGRYHRFEILQGRQTDRSIQRRPERPRDAV